MSQVLKLARLTASAPAYKRSTWGGTLHEHTIHDDQGNHVATVHIEPRDDGRHLHISWVGRPNSTTKSGDPAANTLGPEGMRSAMGAVLEHYPEAEFVSGRRVSGHRGNTSREGERVVIDAAKLRHRFARKRDTDPRARETEFRGFMQAIRHRPWVKTYGPDTGFGPVEKLDKAPLDVNAHLSFADWIRDVANNPADPRAAVVEGHAKQQAEKDEKGWYNFRSADGGELLPRGLYVDRPPAAMGAGHKRSNGLTVRAMGVGQGPSAFADNDVATHALVSWKVPVPAARTESGKSVGVRRGDYHTFEHAVDANGLHDIIDQLPKKDQKAWREYATKYGLHDTRGQAVSEPTKLARMQVPAQGAIIGGGAQTGGTYQKGGQFAAKARKRIRSVIMAWLHGRVQLSEKKAGGKVWTEAAKNAVAANRAKTTGDLRREDLHTDEPVEEPDESERIPEVDSHDAAIHRAKHNTAKTASRGYAVTTSPKEVRDKLTIRELKQVEESLGLPANLRLSQTHPENRKKLDGDKVATLSLDDYYQWANSVARHMLKGKLNKKALERLRNPKHLSKAKLAFLTARLTREAILAKEAFADTGGASKWYGDHVGVMARHLHDSFHRGKDHPEDDELWGKKDEKSGRVYGGSAMTLAKMLVAATSGGMKPHANYDVAHRMISAGKRHGSGSENPFKSIPRDQGDDLSNWVDRVYLWHDLYGKNKLTRDRITTPGKTLHERAKWYEDVIRPMATATDPKAKEAAKTIVGGNSETNQRYSGQTVRYVSDPNSGEHYTYPIHVDKGKNGLRSPYPTTAESPQFAPLGPKDPARYKSAPEEHDDLSGMLWNKYGEAGTRSAKLPVVDDKGRLKSSGWTARNHQVLDGLDKLNAVVGYFTHVSKGDEREGMRKAAEFLLTEQDKGTFLDIIKHAQRTDPKVAKRLAKAVEDNRGFYFDGDRLPGAFLLGPKFGAFAMNLHLDHPDKQHLGSHLTADLWWSRDWNVMLGSLFGGDNEKPKRQETPRGSATNPERKLMRKAAFEAAKRAGLNNVAELQAVLWYYEQQKPKWFGVDTSSTSYLQGANMVAKRERGYGYDLNPVTGHITDADPNTKVEEPAEAGDDAAAKPRTRRPKPAAGKGASNPGGKANPRGKNASTGRAK